MNNYQLSGRLITESFNYLYARMQRSFPIFYDYAM